MNFIRLSFFLTGKSCVYNQDDLLYIVLPQVYTDIFQLLLLFSGLVYPVIQVMDPKLVLQLFHQR